MVGENLAAWNDKMDAVVQVSLFILGWGKEMRKKRVMYQQLFQVKTKEKDDCQRIYDYDNRGLLQDIENQTVKILEDLKEKGWL
ncbi:uncharacterized protein LOC105086276 [Camelus dromedarius]|uniref:uncharacterized protein LOC105086276 n=1 Tax=Camelus dromedarius TaxID=9838 RepID=UPI00057AA2F9